MHLTLEKIRSLADSYVNHQVLDDAQLESKKHMADCDACYRKFCTEYLLIRKLKEVGIIPNDFNKTEAEEQIQKVFLQIRKVGEYLRMQSEAGWNFIYMPQMAAARGNGENKKSEVYVSKLSEYSNIRQEDGKITIQLDGDVFSVENLRVRVITDDEPIIYSFSYDEDVECYCVSIDEDLINEDSVIEIIEV